MSNFVAETMRKGGIVFARRAPVVDVDGTPVAHPLASVVIVREYDAQRETLLWTKAVDAIHDTIMTIRLAFTDGSPALFTDPKFKQPVQIALRLADDFIKHMKASHVSLMPHKHWYVAVVGTESDLHHTGQGSAIMKRITQMADRAGADCYLEGNGPDNKRFYEKFGFRAHGSNEIKNLWDPDNRGDTMTMYYMVRRSVKAS